MSDNNDNGTALLKDFTQQLGILDITEESLASYAVDSKDIPDIELYMDQVTTFIDDKLKSFRRNEKGKLITKTMINNYAKDKLIPPPSKKKYNKNHIMLLLIIHQLKSILSINDISALLAPVVDELIISPESDVMEKIYKNFVMLQTQNKELLTDTLSGLGDIKEKKSSYLILAVLAAAIDANSKKRLAEGIIDAFFDKSHKKKTP